MTRCAHRERSIAGGRSKDVSMTRSKLDAVLTSLAPFQGELSIPLQVLINLLVGLLERVEEVLQRPDNGLAHLVLPLLLGA